MKRHGFGHCWVSSPKLDPRVGTFTTLVYKFGNDHRSTPLQTDKFGQSAVYFPIKLCLCLCELKKGALG